MNGAAEIVAASWAKPALRWFAAGAFGTYLAWQYHWLSRGQLAPALWQVWTGWPCPSTGLTRSLLSYAHGHWAEAYAWNPFTPFYLLLPGLSAWQFASRFWSKERIRLTPELSRCWFLLLLFSWAAKFLLGPRFW